VYLLVEIVETLSKHLVYSRHILWLLSSRHVHQST